MVHAGGYSQIGLLAEKPDHGCEHFDAQRLSRAEGRAIRARMKPNITWRAESALLAELRRARSPSALGKKSDHRATVVASIGETVFLSDRSMTSAGLTVSHFIETELAR